MVNFTVLDTIGHTPLVSLNMGKNLPGQVLVKLENKNPGGNDNNIKAIIIIVCLVIFAIVLSIGMFFLGKKLKNDRKKRANELMDDNYDYTAGINA